MTFMGYMCVGMAIVAVHLFLPSFVKEYAGRRAQRRESVGVGTAFFAVLIIALVWPLLVVLIALNLAVQPRR